MIKINLIPVKRKKKPKPVPLFLGVMVLLLAVSVIGVVFYAKSIGAEIKSLENQKQTNAKKLKELQQKVKEVKNYESLNAQVAQRKEIIEQLTKNQSLPVRLLDEMSISLTDGVWISSLSISGTQIRLSGTGFKNTDIVSFVQSLKRSELFKDVNLLGTSRKMQGKVETYAFNMTLAVAI
jgi:type IV pilus assembly protein PilN